MAQDAAVFLQPLSATAGAPGGSPSLSALTISAGAPGGTPSFEAATAAGEGFAGSTADGGYATSLPRLTGDGTGSAGSVASGDGEFEPLTADGTTPAYTDANFEPLTADATGLTGGVASADVRLEPLTAAVVGVPAGVASGAPSFQPLDATATSQVTVVITGAASFAPLQSSATALVGSVATAAVSFEPLDASTASLVAGVASGSLTLTPMYAVGVGHGPNMAVRTWALNTSNKALTEYRNFDFNSYTEFGGRFYAAGDDGIFELAGTDDDGTEITWSFATGFHDGASGSRSVRGALGAADAFKLKRLEEVLLAVRYNGPLRIRVWTDDETYYDYTVASYRDDMIQQIRSKLGRGTRSRFYKVQISAVGTSAEIFSMTMPMIPLQRRVG